MQYLDLSIANPSFNHRSRRSGWLLANAPVSHIKLRSAPRALDALSIDERVHLTIDVNRGTGQLPPASESAFAATSNSGTAFQNPRLRLLARATTLTHVNTGSAFREA